MNLKTRLRSLVMRRMASQAQLQKQRQRARTRREKSGEPPTVHYFHQVDDPFSHLAVQKLAALQARYNLKFQPCLTSKPQAAYQGSVEHFGHWARRDAADIAADYGTEFAPTVVEPAADNIARANHTLAACLNQPDFAQTAVDMGNALWSGQSLAPAPNPSNGDAAIQAGNRLRQALGHYQGAMFYFEGEWFWGIDRLRLLEQRLADEGYDKTPGPACVPQPTTPDLSNMSVAGITLEYFPSLRSPYTAIGHQRVLDLIANSGITVQVRPVMPMMMRGVPAPRQKGAYIMGDAAREGLCHGAPLGRIVDPFGEPVKQAFALFPAADAAGRGMQFVTAYLQAAWFDGIDITRQQGLQQVVESAGLDWHTIRQVSQSSDWQAILADNLNVLTQENLWGVPSFRVTGGNQAQAYACWGQDRIWRVAREIARRT